MGFIERFVRSGDPVERVGTPAREIDRILSELGRLYLQRQKALRLGTRDEIQAITDRIASLKTQLSQL